MNILFVVGWAIFALLLIPIQLRIAAPYGRHSRKGWGVMIPNRVGWICMELPSLIIPFMFFVSSSVTIPFINSLMIGLFMLHYVNRSLIFPFRIKTQGKKMPLLVAVFAFCFNLVNASIISLWLTRYAIFDADWLSSPYFIIGTLLFVVGFGINFYSDTILINLRSGTDKGYYIPQGGLFNYISCPNLFGEIIEWCGFALLTLSLPALSFAVWTFANLVPRALSHHRWYIEHFKEEYPKDRKAVLPFVL